MLLVGCQAAEDAPAPPSCAPPTQEGLNRYERLLQDASRGTPSNGTTEERATRELRVVIWEERWEASPAPVLLMAHGFDGSPDKYEAFASSLAAQGIIVVAPEFPLTHFGVPGGPQPGMIDLENMPGDLSFVLDALEEANGDPCDPLHGRMNLEGVTAMGHSLGGAVLARATRHDCCVETRITGTLFLAAATAVNEVFFPDSELSPEGPPTLVIHGRDDDVVDLEASEELYGAIDPPKALLVLETTGHSDALESQDAPPPPSRTWMERAVVAFVRDSMGIEAGALNAELARLADEGHAVTNEWEEP